MVKTTIDSRGVIQEAGSGTTIDNPITITSAPQLALSMSGIDADITVNKPAIWVYPNTAVGVTASLPTIVAGDLGKKYLILKSSGSNPCLVSGTQQITEGGLWDYEINTSRAFEVMAASGSAGIYYWHVITNTSLDNGA